MRAVIYVRYSSDNQREESIEAQSRAIKEYCKNNNIEIVKTYADEAKSATTDNRPNFLQMIKEVPRLNIKYVIVHKLDRFARNRYDSSFYKKKLKDNGIRLVSVLENLDDSPESIILESMLEGMAEYYSKNLAREVMKGLKENALKGLHNGGMAPLGLNVNKDKTYSINDSESLIVKLIYDLYLQDYGYKQIASTLNAKGYRTKMNRNFSQTSIKDILINEKYTGTYVFNRRADGKTLRKLKSEDEIIKVENVIPAIITKDIFGQVKIKMENKKRGAMMKTTKNIYLLTGKMYCGKCGAAYVGYGYRGKSKQYIYSCTNRRNKKGCDNKDVGQEWIENQIIDGLKQNIFNDKQLEEIIPQVIEYAKETDSYIENEKKITNDKIKELNKKIDKLYDLYLEEQINKTILAQKTNAFKEELDLYQEKKNELMFVDNSYITEDSVRAFLLSMKVNLHSENRKSVKKVIDAFVGDIYIHEDKIKTTLDIEGGSFSTNVSGKVSGDEPRLSIPLVFER